MVVLSFNMRKIISHTKVFIVAIYIFCVLSQYQLQSAYKVSDLNFTFGKNYLTQILCYSKYWTFHGIFWRLDWKLSGCRMVVSISVFTPVTEGWLGGVFSTECASLSHHHKVKHSWVELGICIYHGCTGLWCWNTNPQSGDIWRRGLWDIIQVRSGHESWTFMLGLVAL